MLSDSNKVSAKRFIGLICLIMFIVYGLFGIIYNLSVQYWIFYVSLCAVTMWIAFKFMSAEKALKYNVLSQLSQFGKLADNSLSEGVNTFIENEKQVDNNIQPEKLEG